MLNASIWLPEHGHEAWVLVFGQIRFYHGSEWCSCICKRCPAQSAKSYGDCDCEMNRTQSKWLNTSQLLQGTVSHSSITAAEALHHLGTEEDWWSEWSFPGGMEGAGELAGGGGGVHLTKGSLAISIVEPTCHDCLLNTKTGPHKFVGFW